MICLPCSPTPNQAWHMVSNSLGDISSLGDNESVSTAELFGRHLWPLSIWLL